MKLYEIPQESYIKLEDGQIFFFDHIVGAYSLCYDGDMNRVHLSASTEIVQYYKNNSKEDFHESRT